jgi:3-hydroxyisobutyrate dehydrogenase-like beta-hydroxyacid dehydrogenase
MKITFIGLGIMGSRMAAHLLETAHEVTVYNRSPEAMKPLEAKGAHAAANLAEAVKDAEIVFSMLADPEAVRAVFFEGALHQMKKGSVWIDCSTVNPSFSREAGEKASQAGIKFIDAPVAGSKAQAEAKQLVFFTGGDRTLIEGFEPLFLAMGKKMSRLGGTGMGSSYKMLVNKLLAGSMLLFSEAVHLGKKMGIEDHFLYEVLPTLPVCAPFVQLKTEGMKTGNYETQFPLELMYKDLHLASLSAYEHQQPLFLANLVKEIFAEAVRQGQGRSDFSAIHEFGKGK